MNVDHSNLFRLLVVMTLTLTSSCGSDDGEAARTEIESDSVAADTELDDTDMGSEDSEDASAGTDAESEDTGAESEDTGTDSAETATESEDTDSESVDTEPADTVSNAPIIQTPSPLIHLADNLDEQDQLGWCIDTRGNGFNQTLHTHSCKPSGGDVQFTYNAQTLQICSAEFLGFCVEMSGGPAAGTGLSLVDNDTASANQRFVYSEDSGEFRPQEATDLCLAAGDTSNAAGIYMARSLTLELSSATDVSLKRWVIVEN